MKKYLMEMFGTFVLVFVGCGAAVLVSDAGVFAVAMSFGLAVVAMAYAIGHVSGAHLNPAVTIGVYSAGRMNLKDTFEYIIFQIIGAVLGAVVLMYLVKYKIQPAGVLTLGENGFGKGFGHGYSLTAAVIYEFVATYIFVRVVLATTVQDLKIAGVVIGLTLGVLLLLGSHITGGSMNPARSFGPALIVGGKAWSQVWVFLLVPSVAGFLAGIVSRICK